MSIMSWIDQAFCIRLVVTLGHFLWQATVIAVLARLAAALLSGATARLRYGVLVLALLVMAACPVATYLFVDGSTVPSSPVSAVTMGGPPLSMSAKPNAPPPPHEMAPNAADNTVSQMSVDPPETASADQGDHTGAGILPTQPSYGLWRVLAPWLTFVYFAGVLGMLGRLLFALHGGRRLGLDSEPAGDAGLLATTAARAKAMGLRVTPAVAYCRRVAVPTVVGILQPMILLPASLLTGLTTEQIEAILTHELAHIRRHDHLVNLLQRVIESALFFHPGVWCVSRLIRTERENCCDDLAVAIGGERFVYASSLVRVGEICLRQRHTAELVGAATLAAADRPCQLRRRIMRLFGGGGTAHERVRLLRGWPMALVLPVFVITAALLFVSANAKPPGAIGQAKPPTPETLEKWLAGKDVVQVRFMGPHMDSRKLLDSLKVKPADNDRTFRMVSGEMATGYSYVKVCMKVSPENTRRLLSIQEQLRATRHRINPANTRLWSLAGDARARAKAREMAPKVLAAAANGIRTTLSNAQIKPERPRAEWRLGGITCKAPGLTKTVYIRIHEITATMKWNFDPSFSEQTIHLPRLGLVVTTYRIPNDVLPPARAAIRKAVNQAVAPLLKLEGDTARRREEMLPPPDRLQVRLALLKQIERKGPLWPEARLYVRNPGSRTINLPRSNHTGRKMKSVFWNVGLSIDVRMPDGEIRSYSFVDESDPTYWSTIRFGPRKTMHTKPIEAGQQISLGISLGDLTDSQGAKLTSLKGIHSLRPVLTTAGAAGKWWLGSATGPWIAVKIGEQPGMAGKKPVFFTPAGRKPATATQPAKAFKASFETLSVEITSTWTWNRTITIKGDGSYTFNPHNSRKLKKAPGMKRLEADPNRYVATYRIGPAHLRQLDKLLGATDWLTRGGKVEPLLKDRTHYALALARGGKTITTTCYGDQEQAYTDLVRFLRRISNQEWLLYQLDKDAGYRFKPELAIGLQLDAAVAKTGTRKPHDPVLDFHRFRPPLAAWLAAPGGRKSSELITAAKLMGYLKIQSQRKALEALAANRTIRDPRVRQAALRALAQLGESASTPAAKPTTQPADAQVKTGWSAAQEGVEIRLKIARKIWRADEIPALRWDVRNIGKRQFLHVAAGQRMAQLEVDGVWRQWPVSLRGARLADLGAGQSLENQLVTVSPIWTPARPLELQWKSGAAAIPIPAKARPPLQLAPGKHTVRLAVIADPSRVNTGKGFRVVSLPLEITVRALPAGRTAVWPANVKLAQAVKEVLFRTKIISQESLRPQQPNMKKWIAQALIQTRKASVQAEKTPLHTSIKRLADTLAALQKAVNSEDPAQSFDEFAEAGKAHRHLLSVFTGEIPLPAPATKGAKALNEFLDRIQRVKRGNKWVTRKRHTRNDAGQITGLRLKEAKLEKNDFVVIGALRRLETLELTRTTVTNDDLKHLVGLKNLRVLKLDWNRNIGDAGVTHLGKLTGLETLNLRLTKVTGKGLEALVGIKNLRHLDTSDTPVDDVGLKHISQLGRLEVLNIGGTKITDKGLHHLKGLKHLRGLTLEETGITNEGLNYLAKFPRFTWISSPVSTAREFVRRLEKGDFTAVAYMYSPSISMPSRGIMTNTRLDPLPQNAKDKKFNQLRFRVEMHWTVPAERIDTTLFGTFAVNRGAIRMHRVGIDE